MRKARILLFLGTWIAIMPYLGFPYTWKDTLTFITGLIVIIFSYVLYREYKKKEDGNGKVFDNFKENNNFKEEGVVNIAEQDDQQQTILEDEIETKEQEESRRSTPTI